MTSSYFSSRPHTNDVYSNQTFDSLGLSKQVLQALNESGFQKPSPIQLQAIPIALTNKSSYFNSLFYDIQIIMYSLESVLTEKIAIFEDLIAQAKSGTGKTLVFAIKILEILNQKLIGPQVVVLSPTREISAQICQVISQLGSHQFPGLYCKLFIGGCSYEEDIKKLCPCNVVVATPGRILQLMLDGYVHLPSVSLLVLDEVDKLFQEGSMKKSVVQIMNLFEKLPQTLCFSATYPSDIIQFLDQTLTDASKIMIDADTPSLDGVKQYYEIWPNLTTNSGVFSWKCTRLISILSKLTFHQCIVFCNSFTQIPQLVKKLNENGWPSRHISSHLTQIERNRVVSMLKEFRLRVVVSSDLTARGLDVERINLVINLDVPHDAQTYLHRIGRTGRFGTYGVAINLITPSEFDKLQEYGQEWNTKFEMLPAEISPELYSYQLNSDDMDQLQSMQQNHQDDMKRMEEDGSKESEFEKSRSKKRKRSKRRRNNEERDDGDESSDAQDHETVQNYGEKQQLSSSMKKKLKKTKTFEMEISQEDDLKSSSNQEDDGHWGDCCVNDESEGEELPKPPDPKSFWDRFPHSTPLQYIQFISSVYLPHLINDVE